jgi:hypothetical protein
MRSDPRGQVPNLTPGGSRVDMKPAYPVGTPSKSGLPAVATPAPVPPLPPLLDAEPDTKSAPPPAAARSRSTQARLAAAMGAAAIVTVGVGMLIAGLGRKHDPVVESPPPPPPVAVKNLEPVRPEVPLPADPPPADPGLAVGGIKFLKLPPDAKVTIDGNPIGNPAVESFFAAGKHQVAIDAKGFLPFEQPVELTAGKVAQLEPALKPRPVVPMGAIDVVCQPWCQISLDGRDTGKTSPARIAVTAGAHTLTLSNGPAGLAKKISVTVGENAVVKKTVKLDD